MKRFVFSLVLSFVASSAFAADYGTITIKDFVNGPHRGNGGQFNWDIVAGPTGLPAGWSISPSLTSGGDLATFCLEIQQQISKNTTRTFDVNELINAPVPGDGAPMDASQAHEVNILATNYYATYGPDSVDNTAAGAFQLAVWDILFGDGDYDVTTGALPSSSIGSGFDTTAANALLAALPGSGSGGPYLSVVAGLRTLALVNGNVQDQLIVVTVPEASSLLAFASVAGAIGMVMYRRRK